MIRDKILKRLLNVPGARAVWNALPVGGVELRVRHGIFSRPHYAYGVYSAADLARRLELPAITVAEFGVAGGLGLLALEKVAAEVAGHLGVAIHVVGFDGGQGMPEAVDHRDLPHVWGKGFYAMDERQLRARLAPSTELVIGNVADTVGALLARENVSPIGFAAFDLDYYSSTKAALRIFASANRQLHLPRVYCYFDDVMWPEHACHNEYVGELCAIREFNEAHADLKLCPVHMLRDMRIHRERWSDQFYALHDFAHPLYCRNITHADEKHRQKRL